MIQINIEMPKDCNACPFSVHYDSGGAHGFYCSLSKVQEHRWGEANDDGFKFADCPISVVENKTQVIDKIRAEIEQEITYKPMEMWDYRMGLTKALEIINKCKAEGGDK